VTPRAPGRGENGTVPLPLIPLAVAGVVVAGAAVALWRLRDGGDATPAPPGTPSIDARLPVALWPARGDEPVVPAGPRGWTTMLAHLAHSATDPDGAERARAAAFAGHRRSEVDARRTVALEVHLMRGRYDPDLIAAAWLYPLRPASAEAYRELRVFGVPEGALAIVEAAHDLDLDDARVAEARRRLAVDAVHPDFGDTGFEAVPADDRALLGALALEAAAGRVAARVAH
jgi:hypothetical protein